MATRCFPPSEVASPIGGGMIGGFAPWMLAEY
jgi:hypothetical protein